MTCQRRHFRTLNSRTCSWGIFPLFELCSAIKMASAWSWLKVILDFLFTSGCNFDSLWNDAFRNSENFDEFSGKCVNYVISTKGNLSLDYEYQNRLNIWVYRSKYLRFKPGFHGPTLWSPKSGFIRFKLVWDFFQLPSENSKFRST